MSQAKITVLKRTEHRDLIKAYGPPDLRESDESHICPVFSDNQEFIIESPHRPPEDFCPWAWADIRKEVLTVMSGGSFFVEDGPAITCCTDGFRPVIFKVERLTIE